MPSQKDESRCGLLQTQAGTGRPAGGPLMTAPFSASVCIATKEGKAAGDGRSAGVANTHSDSYALATAAEPCRQKQLGYASGVRPRWQPDADASACTLCQRPFGLCCRRHHCRSCGYVCCADCTALGVLGAAREAKVRHLARGEGV
eukprot:TRINITY_DN29593_c0_g1_i1.p3 TRINITY_DN29593_c0_g1~~TRINITY_DN29593_c0_g1_i1.p3  ORF type:complete len:146 (+),score=17.65 TRINITY_DN29593_c0_g1_i1:85-522(+)